MSEILTLNSNALNHCAFVNSTPSATASIRQCNADFIVNEVLGFEGSGEGEHVLLQVKKNGIDTQSLINAVAIFAKVDKKNIGYSGLKDKHAITSQWLSIQMPGREEIDWQGIESDEIKVLTVGRNARKLKRGVHQSNQFKLMLRNFNGCRDEVERRLTRIKLQGVPNYFGVQRFGFNGKNIVLAEQWLLNTLSANKRPQRLPRTKKSMYLSVLRSYFFNELLSVRVRNGSWCQYLAGDILQLEGTQRCFVDDDAVDLSERVAEVDCHPTAVLAGVNSSAVNCALAWEQEFLQPYQFILEGLKKQGLDAGRRSLRLWVGRLEYQWESETDLALSFSLPSGSYATSVLRELVCVN